MPDKSAENLARIRACDADWNENDHPRADNGQFTSGSGGGGAKVSKLQSGGKAKVQNLKNVSGALAGVNAGIKQAENRHAAQFRGNLRRQKALTEKADKEIEDFSNKAWEKDHRYYNAYQRVKNLGHADLAERMREKGQKLSSDLQKQKEDLLNKRHEIHEEYGPMGRRMNAARANYEKSMSKLWPQKQALEAEQKKFQGAKKTLEKAKPGIAKMREQAKAAAGSKTEEYKNKINADPKLKAEVMSLKGKPAKAESSDKPKTFFDKEKEKAEKSFDDFREIMQRRRGEIDVLNERLRTTKNSFIAKATKQELDRKLREYDELDQMY